MLVWAPISPASVPHKSNELPSATPLPPPLSSINPPLLFPPISPLLSLPPLPLPFWTSDQLRPCPTLTARQHFLSSSYPLALSFFPSFFYFFFLGVGPATVNAGERDMKQTKGGRKKKNERILYFSRWDKSSVQSVFWLSACVLKEDILLRGKEKKKPTGGKFTFLPARRLFFFFLREEERGDRRWRERYRDKVFAQPSQWENACSPVETVSVRNVNVFVQQKAGTSSFFLLFFWGIDSLKGKSSQYSVFPTVNKKHLSHSHAAFVAWWSLFLRATRPPSLFINYQEADTWATRWRTHRNMPSLWCACTVVCLGCCCAVHFAIAATVC